MSVCLMCELEAIISVCLFLMCELKTWDICECISVVLIEDLGYKCVYV